MKITSCEFIKSVVDMSQAPPAGPFEIALVGKSNVGKSSFINAVLSRRDLAHTSSAPGRTRTANFYLINNEFYFVDLPGYGYAKTNKSAREQFGKIIDDYLSKRDADFMVLHLMDMRHAPEKNDVAMREKLYKRGITPVTVLTKSDKLTKNERAKRLREIMSALPDDESAVFPFSVNDAAALDEIKEFLGEMICSISKE